MAQTAILIPSLNRPHLLAGLAANIADATPEPHFVCWMISDPASRVALAAEHEPLAAEHEPLVWTDDGGTWPTRINLLAGHAARIGCRWLFLGSDDLLFHRGWLSAALDAMTTVDGVVAVNDLFNPNGTSCLVSLDYLAGGPVVHDGYRHNYADTELFETAKARRRFAYCATSIVEHLHWAAGKAPHDDTYARSDAVCDQDRATFDSRRHLWSVS